MIKTNWNYPKESWYLGKTKLVQSSKELELVLNLNVLWALEVQLMIFAVGNKMISMCNLRGRRQLK